jgi:hypothetical protein
MDGYVRVYEAGLAQDGSLIRGQIALLCRERGDAINFCRRSQKKCFLLIGPNGGRLNYIKPLSESTYDHDGPRPNL